MSVSRKVRERSLRLLLGETRNRCMACGKHVGDGEGCSISKIVPRNAERGWVALERRTVLCGECESMKNTFTIPDLANSFSFRARLGYLFRVMGGWLLGRISMVKMRALLYGFSLCQGLPSPNKVIENKREALLHETNFRCVYCGCALEKETMTVDHIVALSRKGTNEFENCVASCNQCNHKKANATVSAFIDSFSDREKYTYLKRVRLLEAQGQISMAKAQNLLGRPKKRLLDWSMRFFSIEIKISINKH